MDVARSASDLIFGGVQFTCQVDSLAELAQPINVLSRPENPSELSVAT